MADYFESLPIPRRRLDELATTILPNRDHVVPAMKDGVAVKLSVAQILGLIQAGDLAGEMAADAVGFTPGSASPLASTDVAAALEELAEDYLRRDEVSTNGASLIGAANYAAMRGLLQTEARIRQVQFLGDSGSRSATSTTSYGTSIGQTQSVTPVSATSKLLVICTAAGVVSRASGSLFANARVDWFNGSVWAQPSGGLFSLNVNGQGNGGTTSTDARGPVAVASVLEAADKNGSGNWQFGLRGNVSTGTNTPSFEVSNCRYIAIEIEGL